MNRRIQFLDYQPPVTDVQQDVLAGLTSFPKSLPSKLFYDARGSALFDQITRLPEYYLTDTEIALMATVVPQLSALVGPNISIVELGSGSSRKIVPLLRHLPQAKTYVAIDISAAALKSAALDLATAFPEHQICAIVADYAKPVPIPEHLRALPLLAVYLGSTIGNFHPKDAVAFLNMWSTLLTPQDGLLIGVDLKKDPKILHRAYNDAQGVTAAFNLNLLLRLNQELHTQFDLASFFHAAFYNAAHGRIEMHLVSRRPQTVTIGHRSIHFGEQESIRTEYSYKYTLNEFKQLAGDAGWNLVHSWVDAKQYFSMHLLRPTSHVALKPR